LIAKQMKKEGEPLHRIFRQQNLDAVAKTFDLADITALYAAVGESNISAQAVVERVIELAGGREGAEEDIAEAIILPKSPRRRRRQVRNDVGVEVEGLSGDVAVKLARCCTPVPGDEIGGFVTRTVGVSVHRLDCQNYLSLKDQPERLVEVSWTQSTKGTFLVAIQVEALDRPRLLSDITHVISDHHVNILSAVMSTDRQRVAKTRFTFEMGDATHLDHILSGVRSVDGVFDVYRVNQ